MAFGKSTDTNRRHRPKKVKEEVNDEETREKREEKLNTQMIPMVVSVVGSIAMLGIVVLGAPYSYGSQKVHYSGDHMRQALNLADASKQERAEADPKVLIDFSSIIVPTAKAPTESLRRVSTTCRQGRASSFNQVTPGEVHKAFDKSTKFLNCALSTELDRLCLADERKFLVAQLMDYKEKRQNVIAFERYRDKIVKSFNDFREEQRKSGAKVAPPIDITDAKMNPDFDARILQNIEALVRNGYLSPKDFGYRGFYVPEEYADVLRVGADRYAACTTRT